MQQTVSTEHQRLINSLGRALYARGVARAEEIWDNRERAQAPGWRDKYLGMAEDILPLVRSEMRTAAREALDSIPPEVVMFREQCTAREGGGGHCQRERWHQGEHQALGLPPFDGHFDITAHRDGLHPRGSQE